MANSQGIKFSTRINPEECRRGHSDQIGKDEIEPFFLLGIAVKSLPYQWHYIKQLIEIERDLSTLFGKFPHYPDEFVPNILRHLGHFTARCRPSTR